MKTDWTRDARSYPPAMRLRTFRPHRPWAAIVGLSLFLATGLLVSRGTFHGLDQYAVTQWMPWLRPSPNSRVTFATLALPSWQSPVLAGLLEFDVYPASVLPSAIVIGIAAFALHRRGETRAAVTWCALWLAANIFEVAGKTVFERPPLHTAVGSRYVHVAGFDHALPSGHTLRSLVVAAAVAYTWRYGWLAVAWAATFPIVLIVIGWHTPTDIAAGAFAALALYAWAPEFPKRRYADLTTTYASKSSV
jgi:hypothetical protein